MCRQMIDGVWYLKQLTKPLNFSGINADDHLLCLHGDAKSYLMALEGDWVRLIRFVIISQIHKVKYFGVRGTEVLNLERYEKEERLLLRGKSQLVLKSTEGKIQVVCCCQIPCLTIRLIVMANEDDIPVEADNEYADKVVGYLADQIDACWKVLPMLLNRSHLTRMYVRKFEKYTVTLHLAGIEDSHIRSFHKVPMKDKLLSLKELNFNREHRIEQWKKFPPLDFSMCASMESYDDSNCCIENRMRDM